MITALVIILSTLLMNYHLTDDPIIPLVTDDSTCAVSSRLTDHPQAEIMVAPVGDYPVWFVTIDKIDMSELASSFWPYQGGTIRKSLMTVSTEVVGDLTITGHQLDGNGVVLFPVQIDTEVELANGSSTILYSADDLTPAFIITNSHISTFGPNTGPYATHPWAAYYPQPGCYKLTGTYSNYSTSIVVEVRDG